MLYIVSVRDRMLDAYMNPWYVPAKGAAIRAFQDELNNTQSPMSKHPDDYDLYCLGTWDESTGKFQQLPQPEQLALGKQLINK